MDVIALSIIFAFGAAVGSFLNCLIIRLRAGRSLGGRSACPKCGRQIAWYDNIPLLSFFLLKRRCRFCGRPISWQYPAVELAAGLLFVLAYLHAAPSPGVLAHDGWLRVVRDWFIIAVMIVIFVYDLKWYLILDKVTLPAMAVVFGLNLAMGADWQNLLISGIIGGSVFFLQFIVSRGRWVGGGDIRLGALMGLALGWPAVLTALFLAYFSGAIVGTGLVLFGRKRFGSEIPFGTFLSLATIATLFFGSAINAWYFSLYRLGS